MVVASQSWELALPGCRSLKEKRSVVRSLRDRLRSTFNVSVSETGLQDVADRAELSLALVASDGRMAQSVLEKTDRFVEEHAGARIVRVSRDLY